MSVLRAKEGPDGAAVAGHYLVACDFDQTLSFNDSGLVLSELIGVPRFQEKVAGLSGIHLVQQGAELAYLLRHDPEFRCVRQEHLIEAGKRVRLKRHIPLFAHLLEHGVEGCRFSFYVVSAAPAAVVRSALAGIVAPEHIYGAEFDYDSSSGEICTIRQVPAGYGKVAILEELETRLQVSPDRTIYVGDGGSDIHVMLHVNNGDGFTIAVSEAKHIARIAKRTVVSDTVPSVLIPILEDIVGWEPARIRRLFESSGLVLQEWDKARTDWLTIRETPSLTDAAVTDSAGPPPRAR
jgi:2-hydroxy-3-keto-5-methylthiopentenyl-1-phosphate phosphatase